MSDPPENFLPIYIVEQIIGHVRIDDLLINVSRVCKRFRHAVLHSKDVWMNSYLKTWSFFINSDRKLIGVHQNWREISLLRYKMFISFSHFGTQVVTMQKLLANTSDPEQKGKLGDILHSAYMNLVWHRSAIKKLEVLFSELSPKNYTLVRDTSGVSILLDIVTTLNTIHHERIYSEDQNGVPLSFVQAQYILYNRNGLPCFFEYTHRRPRAIGHATKQKLMTLKINSELVFGNNVFNPENMDLLKIALLGPQANDVSNELLISILCTIGASADKWTTVNPLFDQPTLQHVFIPALVWSNSIAKPLEAVDFGKPPSHFLFAIPEWLSLLIPRPIAFPAPQTQAEPEQPIYLSNLRRDASRNRKKQENISKILIMKPEDESPPAPFDQSTKKISTIKSMKNLIRYSSSVSQQALAWLNQESSDGSISEIEYSLFSELTSFPNFKILALEKATDYRSRVDLASCSFTSPKTGKTIHLWFRETSSEVESILLFFNGFNVAHHSKRMQGQAAAAHVVASENSGLQEQEGDTQYQLRMANVFANVKQELFGSYQVPMKLPTCLKFLTVLVHSNTWTRKDKTNALPLHTINLLNEFAIVHSVAWEQSCNPTNLDELRSDVQIRKDLKAKVEFEANRLLAKKEKKLQEQKLQIAHSSVVISDPYPICAYKGITKPTPGSIMPLPASSSFIINSGHVLVDVSHWPPTTFETNKSLHNIVCSTDGKRYAGNNYTIESQPWGGISFDERVIHIYEAFNNKPIFTIAFFERIGRITFVGKNDRDPVVMDKSDEETEAPVDINPEYMPFFSKSLHFHTFELLDPLGFVDGRILFGTRQTRNNPCLLQTSQTSPVFKKANLPGYRGYVMRLPKHNNPNYSVEGVVMCGSIYWLNRTTNNFERVTIVTQPDTSSAPEPFIMDQPKRFKGIFATIEKDNRVFCVQYCRLYELVWSTTEPNTIICVEHIPGIYCIQRVQSAESLGLLISCSKLRARFSQQPTLTTRVHQPLQDVFYVIYQPHSSPTLGSMRRFTSALFGLLQRHDVSINPIRNLIWSEPTQLLIAVDDKAPRVKLHMNVVNCSECGDTMEDNLFEKDDTKVCYKCITEVPNKAEFTPRIINQMMYTIPDEKLESESIFRAVKLQDILTIPSFSHESKSVDSKLLSTDRQFSIYSPPLNSTEYFEMIPTISSRTNRMFLLRKNLSNNHVYTCFAYWDKNNSTIPSSFLAPPGYRRAFANPADLVATFLGGPVFFKSHEENIQVGVIVDFVDCQKSDCVVMVQAHTGSSMCAEIMLSSLQWIGVIGWFPEAVKERKQFVEQVKCTRIFVKRAKSMF